MKSITLVNRDSYFTTLWETFEGYSREWCTKQLTKDGIPYFSRRFAVETPRELIRTIDAETSSRNYELHFSVEKFNFDGNKEVEIPHQNAQRIGWTFIIDVDNISLNQNGEEMFSNLSEIPNEHQTKFEAISRIKELCNRFKLFYLIDSRLHIWFPDWETNVTRDWLQLRDNKNKVDALETYLKKVCGLKYTCVDKKLWSTLAHPIRAPYSKHLESNTTQEFENQSFIGLISKVWSGEDIDRQTIKTRDYAENFQTFLDYAIDEGKFILDITSVEEEEYSTDTPTSSEYYETFLKVSCPQGFRREMLWRTVLPYLARYKQIELVEARQIVEKWLEKSGASRYTDRNLFTYTTDTTFRQAKKIKPLSRDKIKRYYPELGKYLERKMNA